MITGARQIGKTYLVRQFAHEAYANILEINFITQLAAKKIFDGDLDAETLVVGLTVFAEKKLPKGKTLIFFWMKFKSVRMRERQ